MRTRAMKSRNYLQLVTLLPSVFTYNHPSLLESMWLRQGRKARDQVHQVRLNNAFIPPNQFLSQGCLVWHRISGQGIWSFFSKKESCTSDLSGIWPSSTRGGFKGTSKDHAKSLFPPFLWQLSKKLKFNSVRQAKGTWMKMGRWMNTWACPATELHKCVRSTKIWVLATQQAVEAGWNWKHLVWQLSP